MKLSEKICYCRKKSGQSQEALAEKLGVSRQAVSKWENGESEPEITKLRMLSETFGVSIDWLLSDEDPISQTEQSAPPEAEGRTAPDWLENLPGHLGRLVRKFGWLAGLYVVLCGFALALMGAIARYMNRQMFMGIESVMGADVLSRNPVYQMGGFMVILGLVLMAVGAVLAFILKKKNK